ncbi:MAG: alanine transaminase [Deltaproteobacteria bacterium CG_4_10_14_0_2_um_filter_43_8]|nr:MAG: alanine transaminase [Deltaproteobacteria bacterium CG11_big_fil_rev_8_21_14_0_20_42_23]PJA20046.1 MAG: alanine transaminase [Deltaproteobacteria bacterium CG_4_10_14_0_2_um_filter_43_8]PJC64780.1 MAG: alanine transaminase [Deltaproteobacteria bacterium CG_4_9_14_0_2_um_filter_42_21]
MSFERVKSLPPYVLATVTNQMKTARKEGKDIINLGMGNPDLPTPHHIVEKLREAALKTANHRYSLSRGIPKLRAAICARYKQKHNVDLDPETEAIVTLGAKEGLSHLILAITTPQDTVVVPNPTYPIHTYSVIISGANVLPVNIDPGIDFLEELKQSIKKSSVRPKFMILSFPSNPTTQVVDLHFFEEVVAFAKEHDIKIIHDLAYDDLCFDGYTAPSILEVPGAKDIAVELYSMSKGYSMPGWRVAFCVGNKEMVAALRHIKGYLDYGMFQPIQIAATYALEQADTCVQEACETYEKRRNVLCDGLTQAGWNIERPKATMFVWAKIPDAYAKLGSMAFSELLMKEAEVCVSPGIGFGSFGDSHVRFALVENEAHIRQAIRGIKKLL